MKDCRNSNLFRIPRSEQIYTRERPPLHNLSIFWNVKLIKIVGGKFLLLFDKMAFEHQSPKRRDEIMNIEKNIITSKNTY